MRTIFQLPGCGDRAAQVTMVRLELSHGLQIFGTCWMMIMVVAVLWSSQLVGAVLPDAVEQCGALGCTLSNTYKNAYGLWNVSQSTCKAASVVYPATEQELLDAVASAVRSNQKIKVSTKYGHSIPKLACPGSDSGVIISSKNYTSIVNIDEQNRTVTAQGGILLRSLVDAVAAQGLALPVSPYWDGLTLAGLLSTGAHGSSLFGKGGAVHEYVIGMRLVTPASAAEGYAQIRVLGSNDEELKAAKVSLGVLGVISTVTLQLQITYKRSLTLTFVNEDAGMEDEILRIASTEEFGDAIWYPGLGQVVYRYDHRAPANEPGDGKNNFTGFQPTPEVALVASRTAEELADSTGNRSLKCSLALATVLAQQADGYGYHKDGVSFSGFPVIGDQNLIMNAGGCQRTDLPGFYCGWDPRIKGLVYFDAGIALPLRNLRAFLGDVRLLRAAVIPESLCDLDLYTGLLFRFVKKTDAYLGTAQLEDMAMIDLNWSRGDNATTPRLDTDVFQELEQLAFDKYGSRPHWGKNRNHVFEGVGKRYENLSRFLATKNKFDPDGFFSSEWSDAILGINKAGAPGVSTFAPHCAFDGLCRCETDEHCAPEMKSFCRPGRIYPDARVCRTEV